MAFILKHNIYFLSLKPYYIILLKLFTMKKNVVKEMYLNSETMTVSDNNGKQYSIEDAKKFLNDCLFGNNNNGTNINMNISLSRLAFDFNFDVEQYTKYLNSL